MAQEEMTDDLNITSWWLIGIGKSYLNQAWKDGLIDGVTAILSATDPRPLPQRLSDWDRERSLVKIHKHH